MQEQSRYFSERQFNLDLPMPYMMYILIQYDIVYIFLTSDNLWFLRRLKGCITVFLSLLFSQYLVSDVRFLLPRGSVSWRWGGWRCWVFTIVILKPCTVPRALLAQCLNGLSEEQERSLCRLLGRAFNPC